MDAVPELVPMLNWVVLRMNVLGSEQKSLRAWSRCRAAPKGQMRQKELLAEALTD